MDFTQLVRDHAEEHPETVMEPPQVTAAAYGAGSYRVVELTDTNQTSRDALRQMQSQGKPVFDAASLYVSGDGEDRQKLSQLYAFLMERFDYKIETSITPAYSLLRHGVGDSRAFATVYAAMCRLAGLGESGNRMHEQHVFILAAFPVCFPQFLSECGLPACQPQRPATPAQRAAAFISRS